MTTKELEKRLQAEKDYYTRLNNRLAEQAKLKAETTDKKIKLYAKGFENPCFIAGFDTMQGVKDFLNKKACELWEDLKSMALLGRVAGCFNGLSDFASCYDRVSNYYKIAPYKM